MQGLPSFEDIINKRKSREHAEEKAKAAQAKAIEDAQFKQEVKELARGKNKEKKKGK